MSFHTGRAVAECHGDRFVEFLGGATILPIFLRVRIQPKGSGTIDTLTTKQRAHLKSLAHGLKPVHQVGKDGVTDRSVTAVREAFNTREILKVKVLDSAPVDPRVTGETLASSIEDAHLVQVIGRTVVLYRPDPEAPETLP